MVGMEQIGLVIVVVWVLLCSAGYLFRVVAGLGRFTASAGVAALYVGCGVASLFHFGLDSTGVLGAAGMAVPCLVTIAVIALYR